MIGSFAGCFIATFLYKLYSAVKTIPSDEFPVPDAPYLVRWGAAYVFRKGLPPGIVGFALAASALGFIFGALRESWEQEQSGKPGYLRVSH